MPDGSWSSGRRASSGESDENAPHRFRPCQISLDVSNPTTRLRVENANHLSRKGEAAVPAPDFGRGLREACSQPFTMRLRSVMEQRLPIVSARAAEAIDMPARN